MPPVPPTPSDDPSTGPLQTGGIAAGLEKARRDKLRKLTELGLDPWGSRFDGAASIAAVREQGEPLKRPEGEPPADDGPTVRVAGRIMLQRSAGSLVFISLADRSGRIQIMLGKKQVGPENWKVVDCLDLGDLIGVDGRLGYSKTGELTVFASALTFLTKSIETPPDKFHGLVDTELKQRMRYVDLIHGEGVRERFIARSRIVASVRQTLFDRGYL